ncbi:MAG: hypothetical protein KF823_11900 [Xanthomonadales bacterium]|nr:hypothetical protein [Xanthomonadales bacterium]
MAKQTVTLRLDEDDLGFLASASLSGATNLSEKIRALIAEARLRQAGVADAGAAWDYSRALFAAPERALRQAELASGARSELVARALAWLPEATAFVLAAGPAPASGEAGEYVRRFEQGLGDRLLALVDSVVQLARAGFPGCHEPDALAHRARSALAPAMAGAVADGEQSR